MCHKRILTGFRGDSGEGAHLFRRERERHSGPKANSSQSAAALALRLCRKCSASSPPSALSDSGEHQLAGCDPRFLRIESPRISMRWAL